MMFHNDSAYALIMENCTKGKGEDDTWKKAFMKALSKEEEEAVHKAAVKDLMGFIKDAVDMGMYYDVMRFTIKCMIYEDESFDYETFYEEMEADLVLKELLPFARIYAEHLRKKTAGGGDMADFFLKTQNIFSDDFGRFLYGTMKNLGFAMPSTEEEVDLIARSVNKKARPGMFLCFIDYVCDRRTKNVGLFWYTMRKYIMPVLGTARYSEIRTNEQAMLREMLSKYAFYIYNVVYLTYIVSKEEQSVEDELDPLVLYWDKDENKKAIDDEIRRFYNTHRDRLKAILSTRVYEGIETMIKEL